MLRGPITAEKFKGQFSGHETFTLRHLWLRKAFDAVENGAPRNIFSNPDAIIRFGVGKNMALAIRHWALACGIIEEEDKSNPFSDQAIVEMLEKKEGIQIARRTVAKYREMLGILASSKRKKLF